jgi:hypothetical protein
MRYFQANISKLVLLAGPATPVHAVFHCICGAACCAVLHAVLCCGVLCCGCFVQAMVFAVTMNSKRNALLALMIATNFVELKGQVYKRTDTNKLWGLACQVGC